MIRLARLFIIISFITLVLGCERDYFFRGGMDGVVLSTDTVMFDTIFTTIGSSTRHFRVYNPYSSDMTIGKIKLMGGSESKFNINIDGLAGYESENVELRAGDSLFVFVEVNIDPNEDENTFVVEDSIRFETKELYQTVKLIAYGQDVVVLCKEKIKTTTFTNEKPYLIYDWAEVDSLEKLTIEAGARIHFHNDAYLNVRPTASIEVLGTKDEPVLFASARLESWYADVPGQWGYIHLMPGSGESIFNYAKIKHATIGLVVDSAGTVAEPIIISNTKIEHSLKQGLLAQTSSVLSWNSLYADAGSASVALLGGGHYNFYHCTIANYFQWKSRGMPALVLSNFVENKDGIKEPRDLTAANFYNSIIYGQASDELGLYFYDELPNKDNENISKLPVENYFFDHVLLKTKLDGNILKDEKHFSNMIINKSPLFKDYFKYDYLLDTLSVAIKSGKKEYAKDYDIDYLENNRLRNNKAPDLGFIERIDLD